MDKLFDIFYLHNMNINSGDIHLKEKKSSLTQYF